MAKAGIIASSISSVVGVIATSQVAAAALIAGQVTTLSAGAATALSIAIPLAGAVIGLALADTFFGKGEEKRSINNYLLSAVCSVLGFYIGSAALGSVALASSAGLVTEEAVKQTVASGVVAEPIKQVIGITTAGGLLGGLLGTLTGNAVSNSITK